MRDELSHTNTRPGTKAVFTLVTASAFFDDVKEWPGPFFDAHQLGVRFDVDVKILLNYDVDGTDVKTSERTTVYLTHTDL